MKVRLAVSGIILQHFRKDRGERQIRPLQIPDDSHICKLMQIVVNLGAASLGKTRRDTNIASFSCLCVDGSFLKRDAAALFLLFLRHSKILFLQICLYSETQTWASSPPVGLLQQICQSKHPCKCYGKRLCVALPLKENITILCDASVGAAFTNVISVRAVVVAASRSPSAFTHCSFVAAARVDRRGRFAAFASPAPLYAEVRVDGAAVIPLTRWEMATHLAYAN